MHSLRKAAVLIVGAGALVPVGYQLASRSKAHAANVASPPVNFAGYAAKKASAVWDYDWDRRAVSSQAYPTSSGDAQPASIDDAASTSTQDKSIPTATARRHLYFVRHGHYNIDGYTEEERGLTELGRKQAAETGKRLSLLKIPFDKVVNSTMTRAKETADLMLAEMSSVSRKEDPLLEEGAPIPPEPPSTIWRPSESKFLVDGSRIDAAFYKYFHRADPAQVKDSHELFICHANVIRYFVCKALQFPPEGWLRIALAHGSITKFTIRPDGVVSVQSVGDAGFQPPELVSYHVEAKKRRAEFERGQG